MKDIWHIKDKDIARLKQSRIVLSLSGGKDSTACALLLERHGIEFERIFMDTGWEHPALYKYIKETLEPRFGEIRILKSKAFPNGMVDLANKKGGFPTRNARYCTTELKFIPAKEYIESLEDDVINVVGIRREESAKRSDAEKWSFDEGLGCDVFKPLVEHTFDDVIAMHQEGKIPPNPLYLQGATRVGCFPCIYSRKSEVDQVAKLWPERINQIERMETDLTNEAHRRGEEDEKFRKRNLHKILRRVAYNRTIADLGVSWQMLKNYDQGKQSLDPDHEEAYLTEYARLEEVQDECPDFAHEKLRQLDRTFFFGRTLEESKIREIVNWSKTEHGGRQYRLFDLSARDGCTRWGLCESPLADEDLVKITEREKTDAQ